MKKGISQIIAAVLLLAVAVSVAGIYSKWAPELAEGATEKAADSAENDIKCRNAGIYLKNAEYDITGRIANVEVENTGTIALYNDITVALLNSSDITGSKTIAELEVDEEQLVEIKSEEIPEEIIASSKECPEIESSTTSINVTQ